MQSLIPLAQYIDSLVRFAEECVEYVSADDGVLTVGVSAEQRNELLAFCEQGAQFRSIPPCFDSLVHKTSDSGYSCESVHHRFATVVTELHQHLGHSILYAYSDGSVYRRLVNELTVGHVAHTLMVTPDILQHLSPSFYTAPESGDPYENVGRSLFFPRFFFSRFFIAEGPSRSGIWRPLMRLRTVSRPPAFVLSAFLLLLQAERTRGSGTSSSLSPPRGSPPRTPTGSRALPWPPPTWN